MLLKILTVRNIYIKGAYVKEITDKLYICVNSSTP